MKIIPIDHKSQWVKAVQELGDSCSNTVGFMPALAYVDHAEKGHILGAVEKDSLVAYVMFRYKGNAIIIVHLCVSPAYRNQGLAGKLIEALYEQEKDYFSRMQLSCRRDYGIDSLWQSLGFTPVAERSGRATKKPTILTTWVRENQWLPSLFTLEAENEDSKTTVVLDTNVVIDLCDGCEEESQALLQPFLNDYVTYAIASVVLDEVNNNSDAAIRNKHREYAKNHFELLDSSNTNQLVTVRDELLGKKPAAVRSNSWYDIMHIATAISAGAE